MKIVLNYCIVDCIRPIQLIEKLGLWPHVCEMSKVNCTDIQEIYSMGTGRRTASLLYKEISKRGCVLNNFDMQHQRTDGAHVFPVKPGLHKFIIVDDFSALYPTIIIAHGLCPSTLVHPKVKHVVKEDDIQTFQNNKCSYSFVDTHVKEGILPQIMRDLLDSRSKAKKQMQRETDPAMKELYNKRQLALKVCANSGYGYQSSKYSDYGCFPVAETICAIGREKIQSVSAKVCEKFGGEVVFGDTDSFAISLDYDEDNPAETFDKIDEMQVFMNGDETHVGLFRKPMFMEFEYAAKIFIIKKKNYVFAIYDSDRDSPTFGKLKVGKDGLVQLYMKGVAPVRSDVSKWS